MEQIVDRLVLWLGLDTKQVDKGLDAMESKLASGLKSITTNFVAPLAAALSVGALFGDYTARADALGKMAADMSVNIEDLHSWSEASARAGGSSDAFQSSVQSLNASLVQVAATGGGRAKAFLEELGIQAKNAAGGVRPVFEVLGELSDKFEAMDKAESMGFGRKLGLDSGTIRLLQGGRKNLDELIQRQKDLGVYSKRDAEITELFNDTVDDMGQALKAFAAIIFRVATPALTYVADSLTDIISFLRKNEPFVLAFFGGIAAVITAALLPAMKKLAVAALTNPMLWVWAGVVAAIAAAALVIDDLYGYMNGAESEFEDFWANFGTPEELRAGFDKLLTTLKETGAMLQGIGAKMAPFVAAFLVLLGINQIMIPILGTIVGVLGKIWAAAKLIFTVGQLIFNVAKLIGMFLMANPILAAIIAIAAAVYLIYENWETVKSFIVAGLETLKNIFVSAFQAAYDGAVKIWSDIADWFDANVIQPIAGLLSSVLSPLMSAWDTVSGFLGTGEQAGAATGRAATVGGVSPDKAAAVNKNVDIKTETTVGNVYVTTQATDAKATGAAVQQAVTGAAAATNSDYVQMGEGSTDY